MKLKERTKFILGFAIGLAISSVAFGMFGESSPSVLMIAGAIGLLVAAIVAQGFDDEK